MNLALVNVKGGVGKTTTGVNLAASFARSGLRVLLVDLDPQGSAGVALGLERMEGGAEAPSSADLLRGKAEIGDTIRETAVPGLALVPASIRLASLDLALARKQEPEKLLKRALAPVRRRYDVTIFDSPPGFSILTVNALAASDAFIVPVVPHHLDRQALASFFALIEEERERIGKKLRLLGILLTRVDHRTRLTDEVVAAIRQEHGQDVFRTEIPINVRLAEAPGEGRTIFDFESWSTGAVAYGKLGAEVLRRARKAELL